MYVYSYQHIDYLGHILAPSQLNEASFIGSGKAALDKQIEYIAGRFRSAGWEGDGEIGLIWLPPFLCSSMGTTGGFLWHVKQRSNGTSWIASGFPLSFEPLLEQNPPVTSSKAGHSIIYSDTRCLVEETNKLLVDTEIEVASLPGDALGRRIQEKICVNAQGQMVCLFLDYIHDCYLRLLKSVVSGGNRSGIKLKKLSAQLDLDFQFSNMETGAAEWLTIQTITSSIWHSFCFQPFPRKMEQITEPVGYKPSGRLKGHLKKHIELRNCIQHQGGKLSAEALSALGGMVVMATPTGQVRLKAWELIQFSIHEIALLQNSLILFATELEATVRKAVRVRCYSVEGGEFVQY